jgi:hypothetical protein
VEYNKLFGEQMEARVAAGERAERTAAYCFLLFRHSSLW